MSQQQSKPYPSYKPSGVEWLGDVPEHWELTPVNNVANIVNGYPFDAALFNSTKGYPIIRIRDLNKTEAETFYNGEFVESASITSDDVLIGMDGNFNVGRWRGKEKALLNQRMCCVKGRTSTVSRLLEYALPIPLKLINDITYSTTVKHLSSKQVEKLLIAIPQSQTEQLLILDFLDHETAKINELMAEQRRLIDLLKEKRQAVISHAVTKGLNPDAPMKDSGIEWLGEVPAHWKVLQFRRICNLNQGLQIEQSQRYDEPGENRYEYITIKSINSGNELDSKEYIESPTSRVICQPSDVLLARTGATGEVVTSIYGVFHNNFFKINYDNQLINRFFLVHYLSNKIIKDYLLLQAGTTTIPDLNHGAFLTTPFLMPDLAEQKSIVEFLNLENQNFDDLIKEAEHALLLLQERRTALISAAVTGKIDVRSTVREVAMV